MGAAEENKAVDTGVRDFSESTQLIGRVIEEQFEILEQVGQGGMGTVFRARDLKLGRLVAVKMLYGVSEEKALLRFRRESIATARLNHKNIVRILKYGEIDSVPYLVMELLDGVTLEQILNKEGRLETVEFLAVFEQVLNGLSHAHSQGVLHRDIKPANIMILDRGLNPEIKLLDFGVAKLIESDQKLTQSGVILGSANYMSPEQCNSGEVTARSDLYSVGCTMYHALAGNAPFDGDNVLEVLYKHVHQQPEPLKNEEAQQFWPVIEAALNKDPSKRPASAEQMRTQLSSPLTKTSRSGNSRSMVISIVFLTAGSLACTALWYQQKHSNQKYQSEIGAPKSPIQQTTINPLRSGQSWEQQYGAIKANLARNDDETALKGLKELQHELSVEVSPHAVEFTLAKVAPPMVRIYLTRKDFQNACSSADSALEMYSKLPEKFRTKTMHQNLVPILKVISDTLNREHQYELAKRWLGSCIKNTRSSQIKVSSCIYYGLTESIEKTDGCARAEKFIDDVLPDVQDFSVKQRLLVSRARLQRLRGRKEKAFKSLQAACELGQYVGKSEPLADNQERIADELIALGKKKEALAQLEICLPTMSEFRIIHSTRISKLIREIYAELYGPEVSLKKCSHLWDKLTALHEGKPTEAFIYFNLGISKEQTDPMESIRAFQKSADLFDQLSKSPDQPTIEKLGLVHARALAKLAASETQKNNSDEAERLYLRSLNIHFKERANCPEVPIWAAHLAVMYEKQQRYEEATKLLQDTRNSIRISGDSATAKLFQKLETRIKQKQMSKTPIPAAAVTTAISSWSNS